MQIGCKCVKQSMVCNPRVSFVLASIEFRLMSSTDMEIEGNWNIGIAMDMNLADAVYPLTYDLKNLNPRRLNQPEVVSGLIGSGTAPWGEFTNLSVQWGNYCSVLHIYQWNLWLTCTLFLFLLMYKRLCRSIIQ